MIMKVVFMDTKTINVDGRHLGILSFVKVRTTLANIKGRSIIVRVTTVRVLTVLLPPAAILSAEDQKVIRRKLSLSKERADCEREGGCPSSTMWAEHIRTRRPPPAKPPTRAPPSDFRPSSRPFNGPETVSRARAAGAHGGSSTAYHSASPQRPDSSNSFLSYSVFAFHATLEAMHTRTSLPIAEKPPPFELAPQYRTSMPILYEDLPILLTPLVFIYLWRFVFGYNSFNGV